MPDFSSVGSVQRYLAALEEQKRLEEEKARAATFNVGWGGPPQGPQPRPVQGPQPRPVAAPAPQPVYSFTPPQQTMGPQPRPVQGPAPRPEPNPWQAALDSWQSGPPEAAAVNIPVTYDVQSMAPSVSYGYDRPDTGPTGLDTVASFNPATVNADQVQPFDPMAPQMPNAWGISRFGGGNLAVTNPTLPMAAAGQVGAIAGPLMGQGLKAVGNTIWDAYKSAVYGDPNEAAAGSPGEGGGFGLGGDNVWSQSAQYLGDWFNNSAAKERFDEDVNSRAADRQRVGGLGWGEWADEKLNALSGAIGGLQGALANQTMGQGNALELGGALLGTGLTAADSLLDSTSPSRWATDQLLNLASGMQAGQDALNTIPLGEGNLPLGTVFGSAYETITDPKVREAAATPGTLLGGDLWKSIKDAYWGAQQSYVDALRPTEDQAENLTPEQIAKNQGRSLLNWADPASVAKTMDALSDQGATVTSLTEKAKQALAAAQQTPDEDARQELMAQAADYGAQAYKLENTSPIALVNENTNLARQMIMELLQPDVTDLAGGLFSALDLTPAARRLTRATGEVIDQDAKIFEKLADYIITPENKAAAMAERSSYSPYALYKPSAWWTTGAAQAEIATDKLHRFVTNLMADVQTTGDAKMLLRQLATDPAKLISGMSANLFQSPALLNRADDAGVVRFGNMGILSNYGAQDTNLMYKALGLTGDKGAPLRIYQQMADEFLETATSLKSGPLLNPLDFANEFLESMQKQGYKYFNVADDAGEAQKSLIGTWGHAMRKTVSPLYIYTNPGGWATNYISGVLGALGDKAFSIKSAAARNDHLSRVFGPVDPTVRGLEGAASATTAAGNMLPGQAGQGIMGTLKKWYGNIDESVGGRVYYSAVTQALQKTGKDVLTNAMAPIFQQMGIDAQRAGPIINHLFETGYSGGNMLEEFNKLVTGQARVFSLSDVNAGWLDALPADSLTEFYDIIRKAPDVPTAQSQLTAWADKAAAYWDNLIQQSPVTPARHSWMNQEVVQDTADLAQVGKMAEKYGGIPGQQIAEWKKATAAAMQDTQARMEALMNVVTESANPQNRYMLYNVWGQVTDMTADVRNKLGDLAERAGMTPAPQRGQAWSNYWTEAQKLWSARNESVNKLLEGAAGAMAKGEDFTPQLNSWDILERTARLNEQKLWDTLRLEPGAAAYDTRLKQVIDAGRKLTDKAVARTYAAARRFAGTDAMDYIVSAERNAQMAGAQARAYLDEVLETVLQNGKWEDYYSIRNETWRQLRQYEQQVWGIAERNIVRDGLGAEKATGLKFNAGPDGVVELVSPTTSTGQRTSMMGPQKEVTTQTHTDWIVRREDGTTTTVPDNMVPADLKRKYNGVTDDDVEAAVEMELDNIASAHPFAEDAQRILDETKPTAVDEAAAPLDEVTGPVTPEVTPAAVADATRPTTAVNPLQTLRDAARDAGLPTANANGSPLDLPTWNAVKKYFAQNNLPLTAQKLTDLAGDELNKAIQFLQERAGVTKASDMYRAEAAGATAGAKELAALWDADATATLGLPSMENMAKQYKDGQRTFEFEDLYGRTVAGKRIENSNDVLKLVEQYIGLRSNVTTARESVKSTQKYAKMSKAEILRTERDNLLKWGYSTEEINTASRNDILRYIEIATQKDLPDPNMIYFEGGIVPGVGQLVDRVRKALNLGNSDQLGDLNKIADQTIKNTTAAGGMYAPDLAYAAQHARDQIANILAYVNGNLDNIMAPKGAIAEGQALRAVNDFRRQVMPAWDNAKAVASEYGNRMRSFTMIDFSNNTRLDEVAALFFPYSFWSTRAMKNSRERMIFEPHIWRRMMQAHNYMGRFADQAGDPDRYDGMIPVNLGNGMTYYLRVDPTKYWPTLGLFMQNDYADPESANNALSFGLESVRSSGFNPYPWFDAIGKAISNVKEGKPIGRDMSVIDYVPAGKPLAWMAARVMGPNLPQALQPGYFEYNIGRELTTMVSEGSITPEQAQYAQELLRMMRSGESILPEMQGQQDALNAILRTATERAADKELLSSGSSWATGVQVKPFDQDERQAMQASQTYRDRAYNPTTNPYGSEMAQNYTFEQNPELRPRFSQSAVINEEMARPGVSASFGQKIETTGAARDGLYAAGDAAVDAYLKQNPMATKKEIAAARTQGIIQSAGQYVDQATLDAYLKQNPGAYYSDVVKFVTDTLGQQYPSADLMETGKGEKNYAPVEQKWNFQEDVLKQAAAKFPYPAYPEGGTNEQIAAYMKQKEAIDQQRKQWQMAALTSGTTGGAQLVTAGEGGWKPWESGLGTDPTTAAGMIEDNKYKYATDAEKARLKEIEQYGNIDPRTGFNKWGYDANGNYNPDFDTMGSKRGAGSANYRQAYNNVAGRFSKEELAIWEGYYKLPKGEAREQYKKDNPGFKFLNLYAYHKDAIEDGMSIVGVDGALAWSRIPAYDGTPENKAARDAYFDENPKAFLFHSWLNGRPANYKDGEDQGDDFKYNFGADYAEAQTMFGENIWDIVAGYKRGWDKAQTSAYFKANPKLGEFFDWWYGNEKKSGTGYGRAGGGFGGGGFARYEQKEKDTKGFNPAYQRPFVEPDQMDNFLMPRENYINKWQPQNANTAWLSAGQRLAPDRLSKWTPGSKKSNG